MNSTQKMLDNYRNMLKDISDEYGISEDDLHEEIMSGTRWIDYEERSHHFATTFRSNTGTQHALDILKDNEQVYHYYIEEII